MQTLWCSCSQSEPTGGGVHGHGLPSRAHRRHLFDPANAVPTARTSIPPVTTNARILGLNAPPTYDVAKRIGKHHPISAPVPDLVPSGASVAQVAGSRTAARWRLDARSGFAERNPVARPAAHGAGRRGGARRRRRNDAGTDRSADRKSAAPRLRAQSSTVSSRAWRGSRPCGQGRRRRSSGEEVGDSAFAQVVLAAFHAARDLPRRSSAMPNRAAISFPGRLSVCGGR